jgi:hypothetical protein
VSAAAALVLVAATAAALAGTGNELYGKPLRGLSAVPLAEVKAQSARYAGKAIRVGGTGGASAANEVTLSEGGASLLVRTDGSFSLPATLDGAQVTAEGKLKDGAFVASGVEVKR